MHAKSASSFLAFVQNLSDRLVFAIKRAKSSKGALAQACGVAASTVSRWQSGITPHMDSILQIAAFLGVDAKWLMTGDGVPYPSEIATSSANPKDFIVPEEPGKYEVKHNPSGLTTEQRLASMETILERIAVALEKLVENQ